MGHCDKENKNYENIENCITRGHIWRLKSIGCADFFIYKSYVMPESIKYIQGFHKRNYHHCLTPCFYFLFIQPLLCYVVHLRLPYGRLRFLSFIIINMIRNLFNFHILLGQENVQNSFPFHALENENKYILKMHVRYAY